MKQNSNHRTEEEYYIESKRLRAEVMQIADTLKNCPMRFTVTNGIKMDVEVTKSDLKTIASKNTQDNRFNAFKISSHRISEVLLKRQNMRDGVRLYLVNIQKLPILHISAENWAKKHIYVSVK